MFNTIIVGVDGRAGGRDALALADRLRAATSAGLIALQAYPYEYFVSRGANADFDAVMRDDMRREVAAELERAKVSCAIEVVPDGSPARALHKAAERHGAGLIVVGSAHRGRAGRVLAGDVSAGTLHGSPVPVVVAPAGYAERGTELKTIGIGFDGSPESRAAVELAHQLSTALGGRLEVMCVLEPSLPWASYPSSVHDWNGEVEAVREATRAELDKLIAELGPGASGEVLEGDPVRELLFEGKELDLLICGSRAYGPLRRLLLGSTSSKLLHQAPCPVMVLPRGAIEHDPALHDAAVAEAQPS